MINLRNLLSWGFIFTSMLIPVSAFSQSSPNGPAVLSSRSKSELKNIPSAAARGFNVSKGNRGDDQLNADKLPNDYKKLYGSLVRNNACSNDSYSVSFSLDGEAFTVFFNEFSIDSFNPNEFVEFTVDRRTGNKIQAITSCFLSLKTTLPYGWTFAITDVSLLGMVNLTGDARGNIAVNYGFPVQVGAPILPPIPTKPSTKDIKPGMSKVPPPGRTPPGRTPPAMSKKILKYFSQGNIPLNITPPETEYSDTFLKTLTFATFSVAPCQSETELNIYINLALRSPNRNDLGALDAYVSVDMVDTLFRAGIKWIECDRLRSIGASYPSLDQ